MGNRTGVHVGRRHLNKLSDRMVRALKDPGFYGDGGGLYVQVSPTGSKSWIFRYARQGREHQMGLGSLNDWSLAEARERATTARKSLARGVDPLEAKRESERAASVPSRVTTFRQAADDYIKMKSAEWKNDKHHAQWESTLETYAHPTLGAMDVGEITTADVQRVLEAIWLTKTETATRVRQRIEAVIATADKKAERERLNPARWRGHLDALLPKPAKVAKKENHPSLPYKRVGEFMQDIRSQAGFAALLVQIIVLTAVRTSEAVGAKWDEFDLDERTWLIPKDRMKADKDHLVPLSDSALAILKRLREVNSKGYVFPGGKEGKPMSNMAGLALLRRMNKERESDGTPLWVDPKLKDKPITVHGFRSTFRVWCGEQTNFPHEVAEMALAHTIKNKTEAAYMRGDMFEKRAKLMQAWDDYCGRVNAGATVTQIGSRRSPRNGSA